MKILQVAFENPVYLTENKICFHYKCCIVALWLIDIVFFFLFCQIMTRVCTVCKSQVYFIMLSPSLSVPDTICLHLHFSVSRPGMGGMEEYSLLFLFVYMWPR